MSVLLDSHALLWALHAPHRLDKRAAAVIRDSRQAVYFSAASVWELELKAAKGKLTLPDDWIDVAHATGFLPLQITTEAARASARLPWHHNDPFDRLLVAQAIERGWRIVTRDAWINAYPVGVLSC